MKSELNLDDVIFPRYIWFFSVFIIYCAFFGETESGGKIETGWLLIAQMVVAVILLTHSTLTSSRRKSTVMKTLVVIALALVFFANIYLLGGVCTSDTAATTECKLAGANEAYYFSIVTFTTLGYGDIAPQSDFMRLVAAVESLVGLFLVLLLAVQIGVLSQSKIETPPESR